MFFSDFRLNSSTLANENQPQLECSNAAGKLKEWTLVNDMDSPLYELVEAIGPSHSRIFNMKCSLLEHTTQGELRIQKQNSKPITAVCVYFSNFRRREIKKDCEEYSRRQDVAATSA